MIKMKIISLEDITLANIAVTLWCSDSINDEVSKIRDTDMDKWEEIENTVAEKASKLSLTHTVKDKLLVVIEQVGLSILSWIYSHKLEIDLPDFMTDLQVSLKWTLKGTIDKLETAKSLVKNETVNDKQRFFLACIYCLEDCVSNLEDESCHHGGFCNCMKSFWNDRIGGFLATDINDILVEAFRCSAYDCNETAASYFYNKLSLPNNNIDLVFVTSKVAWFTIYQEIDDITMKNNSDVLFFLLSKLNQEQIVNFFGEYRHVYGALKALLVWPKHKHFIEGAKIMWAILCKKDYIDLFQDIVEGVSRKRPYLSELIEPFWQESPERHKRYIISNGLGSIIIILYLTGYKRNMQIILKDLSVLDKRKIICCDSFIEKLMVLTDRQRLHLYEYFIHKCVLSPEEAKIFKDSFRQHNLD